MCTFEPQSYNPSHSPLRDRPDSSFHYFDSKYLLCPQFLFISIHHFSSVIFIMYHITNFFFRSICDLVH